MSDAKTLQQFYSSSQGKNFGGALQSEIERFLQVTEHEKTAGLGFATPYAAHFRKCDSFLDAAQFQFSETQLPIRNSEFNRVLAVHFLENSDHPKLALDEIWRALEPDGQLLLIIPNANSMWKKTAIQGRINYTTKEIEEMLTASKLHITHKRQAIFHPPEAPAVIAKPFNQIAQTCCPFFGAVTIFSARKHIFQSRGRGLKITESILDKLMPKKNIVQA